jgi:hypothetical protein
MMDGRLDCQKLPGERGDPCRPYGDRASWMTDEGTTGRAPRMKKEKGAGAA